MLIVEQELMGVVKRDVEWAYENDLLEDSHSEFAWVSVVQSMVQDCHRHIPLDVVLLSGKAENCTLTDQELMSSRLHDWFGIYRHWDPVRHEMRDCFMPRFAK